jgi:hypothetical protein
MAGRRYRRPAFNVTARLDRGAAKTLVISTPRSGWFGCAGERGSGLAAWLLLAQWAARAKLPVNVALDRHQRPRVRIRRRRALHRRGRAEAEGHGALGPFRRQRRRARLARARADPVAAAQRRPAADPGRQSAAARRGQRRLRRAAGARGALRHRSDQTAGELASILKAGYDPIIGIFGTHRFHHTRSDDLRCVSAPLIPPVASAMARVVAGALKA